MRTRDKTSIAAQTALEVLETIGRGKKRSVKEIAIRNGATVTYAKSGLIQRTKEYKGIINTAVSRMENERYRILEAMEDKDLGSERYDSLVRSMALLTHDIQLLSGNKTENIGVEEDKKLLIAIVAQLRGDTTA